MNKKHPHKDKNGGVTTSSNPDKKKKSNYILQYRSNLKPIVTLMNQIQLKDEHKTQLRKTPFWSLLQACINKEVDHSAIRKFDLDAVKIVESYKPEVNAFQLGCKFVHLRDSDISLIFGIPSGQETINLTYAKKPNTDFVKRRFAKNNKLTAPEIKELLLKALKGKNKVDHQDVARLICMYMFVTLLFSTSGQRFGWAYLPYVENLNKMKKYAWPEAIRRTLMSSIEKMYKNPEKVTGCVIALLYWLCEHTTILKPPKKEKNPRFLKWKLGKLHENLEDAELSKLKKDEVLEGELKATIAEEKVLATPKAKGKRLNEHEDVESLNDDVEGHHEESEGMALVEYEARDQIYDEKNQVPGDLMQNLDTLCNVIIAGASQPIKRKIYVDEQGVLEFASDLRDEHENLIEEFKHQITVLKEESEKKEIAIRNLWVERDTLRAEVEMLSSQATQQTTDSQNSLLAALETQKVHVASLEDQIRRLSDEKMSLSWEYAKKILDYQTKMKAYDTALDELRKTVEDLCARNKGLKELIEELAVQKITQAQQTPVGIDKEHTKDKPESSKKKKQSPLVQNLKQKKRKYNKPLDYTNENPKKEKKLVQKWARKTDEELAAQTIVNVEHLPEHQGEEATAREAVSQIPKKIETNAEDF